jgi:hypothetical protein
LAGSKGWPAARAGIQIGDRMLDHWNVHPQGGFLEFRLARGDQVVLMRLRTERVCFREDGPW